jgi:L-gulonate 3-dehydrogenase
MRTAIIGAGLVGRAWAISFARAGHAVRLWDADHVALPAALAFIDGVLPDLAASGLLGGAEPADVLARIAPAHELAEALAGADHVQENTPERVEVKARVFLDLDRLAPPAAVIASSTSALLPSAFQAEVAGRARCLVCHPINPPYLIPAVEVVPSPWTSPEVVARTAEFLRGCGQTPLVMKREIDGFIMNRIQGALMEECFRLVADGVASAEDVDIGIRDGLALRWSFMGPFETIDLNAPGGVRDYAARYQGMYERIFPSMQRRVDWSGPVMDDIEAERAGRLPRDGLAARQAWRDRRLMALLAHKRDASGEIGD